MIFGSYFQRARRTLASQTHSGRRWRAIGLSMLTSMSDRVVSGVCSLLQVPLALKLLGQEAFGLWMAVTSLVNIMYIADFGLGNGIQNRVSAAYGREDMADAQRVANTGMLMLGAIGLVLFLISASLSFLIDWGTLFHVQDPELHRQTRYAVLLIAAAFCLGLPLTASFRIGGGVQLVWMINVKGSITSVVIVLLIALAVWLKLEFLPFLAVAVAPLVLSNLVLLIVLYRRLGWSLNPFATFDRALAYELFSTNWLFVLPGIGGTILSLAPPLLISSILGASALTPYNLIQRVLGLAAQAQTMFVAPMGPAYAEAVARGDIGWTRATYLKTLLVSFVFSAIPTLSFIFWGRWALYLWSHRPPETFDMLLVVSLSVWMAVSNFSQPPAVLLNALGKLKGQASYGLISVIIALVIMPWMVGRFGAAGAPLSLLVTFGVISLPLVLWETSYHLGKLQQDSNASP